MEELSIEDILHKYTNEKYTLRQIARLYKTNHHAIKRILTKHNIKLDRFNRRKEPFTKERLQQMSVAARGNKNVLGKKQTELHRFKNMQHHLKWKVPLEWLQQFEIKKLQRVHKLISHGRNNFTVQQYQSFVEKFYYDEQFNNVYSLYQQTQDPRFQPSIDHIIPVSRGGTDSLDNLQVTTWAENRAKFNMNQEEWINFIRFLNKKYKEIL